MEVSQKRKLLEAIDTLIRRPAQANERTLVEAMAYFKLLVEEVAQGEILSPISIQPTQIIQCRFKE